MWFDDTFVSCSYIPETFMFYSEEFLPIDLENVYAIRSQLPLDVNGGRGV